MELFIALGVDSTVWIQFTLTLIIFLGLTYLAFKPFQEALNAREDRTVGGVEKASQIIKESEELQSTYEKLARELNASIKAVFQKEESLAKKEAEEIQLLTRQQEQQKLSQFKNKLQDQIQSEKSRLDQLVSGISDEIVKKATE